MKTEEELLESLGQRKMESDDFQAGGRVLVVSGGLKDVYGLVLSVKNKMITVLPDKVNGLQNVNPL